jgi:hypothetical protein
MASISQQEECQSCPFCNTPLSYETDLYPLNELESSSFFQNNDQFVSNETANDDLTVVAPAEIRRCYQPQQPSLQTETDHHSIQSIPTKSFPIYSTKMKLLLRELQKLYCNNEFSSNLDNHIKCIVFSQWTSMV